jgi:hypothetical protein
MRFCFVRCLSRDDVDADRYRDWIAGSIRTDEVDENNVVRCKPGRSVDLYIDCRGVGAGGPFRMLDTGATGDEG